MAQTTPQLPGTMIVQDPWDEAFGAYQQALVDLNGDGIPDAVVPQRMSDAGRRRATVARLNPNEPAPGQEAGARAVRSYQDAYENPTLGNAAYAGLQTALLAAQLPGFGAPGLPLRYAIPAIGTDIGIDMMGEARAQGAGLEARLRQMSPQELTAYQRSIGVPPDGRIGPQTIAAAQRYETEQRAKAEQAAETDRIRAQGDAAGAQERARILAQAEADANKAKAASELSAQEAQRPFLQRNPDYSTYAPYVAGGLAAALPFAGALMSRRATTMPARQQARSIDSAIEQFNAAPTPLSARTAAQAVSQPAAPVAPPSRMNAMLDYASMGVGAALPSAAVVAPYFVDYMQPAGTEAHQKAAEQFTVPKLVERMTGPFALGMAMAGGGRFLGDKAGQAFINPAPRGANLAQANVLNEMVRRSPDDVALTDNLLNSIRGGQTSVLENKRLRGAISADPPRVTFDDIGIGNLATQPRRGGSAGSLGARALPESDFGATTKSLPPLDRGAGPLAGPVQPPSIPPGRESTSVPSQRTRSGPALGDPQRLEVQEQLLSGATADRLAQQYGVSKASIASIQRNTEELVKSVGGDRTEALRQIQGYKKFRDFTYAAPVASGAALNPMLQTYYGD
jgi:hypothetical protein